MTSISFNQDLYIKIIIWNLFSLITYFTFVSLLIARASSISLISKAHSSSSTNHFQYSLHKLNLDFLPLSGHYKVHPINFKKAICFFHNVVDATYLNKLNLEPCTQNLFLQIYVQVYVQNLICACFIS